MKKLLKNIGIIALALAFLFPIVSKAEVNTNFWKKVGANDLYTNGGGAQGTNIIHVGGCVGCGASGGLVTSLNGLTGAVTLSAGTNISLVPTGNDIQINSTSSGTIGGTIAATQIAFGSAADTIAGSNNLKWNNATGTFSVFSASNDATMLISPSTGIYQYGDIDGALNGSVATLNDTLKRFAVDLNGLPYISLDQVAGDYKFGNSTSGSYVRVNDAQDQIALYTNYLGSINPWIYIDGDAGIQFNGDFAGNGNHTYTKLTDPTSLYEINGLKNQVQGGPSFSGTGVDDFSIVSTNLNGTRTLTVTIDDGDPTSPNTFTWDDGFTTVTNVLITGGSQTIGTLNDIVIKFGSITGHDTGDFWNTSFTVTFGGMEKLDGQNEILEYGDIDNISGHTRIRIAPGTIGDISLMGTYNATDSTLFATRPGVGLVAMGDIDGSRNGNFFTVQDFADKMFFGNNDERAVVGINTSTPSYSLDVAGDASLASSFSGVGLDDMTPSINGTYSGFDTNVYVVEIDGNGTPDTVSITKNGVTLGTTVAITGGAQGLADNIEFTFAATTGHTITDHWTITATPKGIVNVSSAYFMGGNFFAQQQTGDNYIVIGDGAAPGISGNFINSVVMGINAGLDITDSSNAVIIGTSAGQGVETGGNLVVIGQGAGVASDASFSIALGSEVTGYANSFIAGGDNMNISNVWFGSGKFSTSAIDYTINGSGGRGSNSPGGNLLIAGGKATGNADPQIVSIQTTTRGASSATPQTLHNIQTWDEFQSWSRLGERVNRVEVSGDTALGLGDYYTAIKGAGGNVRISLPAASTASAGTTYVIKDAGGQATTFVLDIKAFGSDKIDGANIYTLTNNFQSITIVSDGNANWEII